MKRMLIKVLWVVLLGAAVYGGYVAYERWWRGGAAERGLKEQALQVAGGVQKTVEKNVSAVKDKAGETAGEYLSKIAEEAEQSVVGYVKEKVGGVLSSLGESISSLAGNRAGVSIPAGIVPPASPATVPAAQGGQFVVPPPPAAISTKVDTPFVLAINRESSYEIVWGDGTTEEGAAPPGQTTLITHHWSRVGDYTVETVVREASSVYRYTFPVRVYD